MHGFHLFHHATEGAPDKDKSRTKPVWTFCALKFLRHHNTAAAAPDGCFKSSAALRRFRPFGRNLKNALRDFVYLRNNWGSKFERLPGRDVVHIMEPDLRQEIYGVPYYLAALSSIELNSAATKFRVRYYRNGSHAGFILYATDDKINEAGWALVKQELRKAKGGGNFNNLLLRAPNGNPEGVKLIPIAEVGAKDEFLNIKGVSAEDMMAAHRVPPALMGIVPKATSGLGDAITAAKVFARNEVAPLQQTFLDVNDRLGIEVFRFDKYVVERTDAVA